MRFRLGVASGAFLGLTCLAAPAWAQYVTGRAAVSLAGTYTATVTDATFPTAFTQRVFSTSLTPSFFLIIETPRTNNTLEYDFALTVPLSSNIPGAAATTYANRLNFSNRTELDPRTTLSLLLGFSAAPANTLNTAAPPTDTTVNAVPPGLSYLITFNGTESVAYEVTPEITFTQALGVSYSDPVDPTTIRATTLGLRPSLALSRVLGLNTVSISATSAYTRFGVSEGAGGAVIDAHDSVANTLALTWLRQITLPLSASITAGVTQNLDINGPLGFQQATQPTGAASLTYAFLYADAVLGYAHQAAVNVATATTNFTDTVNLRVSVPFGVTGFSALANAAFNHAVPTDGTPSSNNYLGDLGLNYTPRQVPSLTAGVRGQIVKQSALNSDPTTAFTRYALSLSLTFAYPDPTAVPPPRPSFAPLYSAVPATVRDPTLGEPPGGLPEPEPPPPKK